MNHNVSRSGAVIIHSKVLERGALRVYPLFSKGFPLAQRLSPCLSQPFYPLTSTSWAVITTEERKKRGLEHLNFEKVQMLVGRLCQPLNKHFKS